MESPAQTPRAARGTTIARPSPTQRHGGRDWPSRARCRDSPVDAFYPPTGESRGLRRRREELAKQVCAECPVRRQCRDYALAADEPYGVWGGMTETERRRQIHRGRPGPE
ncbi:MAG: WhiB family transcriptional regulator [Gordonia sp. (in: high G+C Gram-positive bacteria)]